MNLYSTTSGSLSLPAGTYFVTSLLEIDLSVSTGVSFDREYLMEITIAAGSSSQSFEGTATIGDGLLTGSIILPCQGVFTLSSSGTASVSFSVASTNGNPGTLTTTLSQRQLQAFQLSCESLNSQ